MKLTPGIGSGIRRFGSCGVLCIIALALSAGCASHRPSAPPGSPDDLTSTPAPDGGGTASSGSTCSDPNCHQHHGGGSGSGTQVTTAGGCEEVLLESKSRIRVTTVVPVTTRIVARTTTGQAVVTTETVCDEGKKCGRPGCTSCKKP